LLAAVTPAARDGGGWWLVCLALRKPLQMRPNEKEKYCLYLYDNSHLRIRFD
jgi:hypothetical protein